MSLSAASVQKVANLARLSKDLSPEELEKYLTQLSAILEYVEELKEVDVSAISATAGIKTIFIDDLREDFGPASQADYQRIRANIIQNFPQKKGSLLLLPVQIIEQ